MTPAQSLTEVIQPTSLAGSSSLLMRLMPSPVVSRWISCKEKDAEGFFSGVSHLLCCTALLCLKAAETSTSLT
ncbi:hypothetical protein EYF80_007282 [Liparis tanakae]|uniref:Uncharacterized protein n=1 Tax=Liparis tanakae TaxID=230148 RepID=A0A4Z2IXF5_9TELE|nr:hypothetical protein EYF80_007282 [Liparis tanakae]